MVAWENATMLPLGCLSIGQNCRFNAESAATRYGWTNCLTGANQPITSSAYLRYLGLSAVTGAQSTVIGYDLTGNLWYENEGGTTFTKYVSLNGYLPLSGPHAAMITAFNRLYIAPTGGIVGAQRPMSFDPTRNLAGGGDLQPMGGKQNGVSWTPGTVYAVGHIVSPPTPNGFLYRCVVAGTSNNAPPTFPTGDHATVTEAGGVEWQENTPTFGNALPYQPAAAVLTHTPSGGTIPSGKDVYVKLTFLNSNGGETSIVGQPAAVFSNTSNNDEINIAAVAAPAFAWLSGLGAGFVPNSYNVYYANVTHSAAAPADSAYVLYNIAPLPLGFATNITDLSENRGAYAALNTFALAPVGNMCGGNRWMIVLYKNFNGNIMGYSAPMAVPGNLTSGFEMYVGNIPIGPAGITAERVLAFTVAGDNPQGQYFWIDSDDYASPGGGAAGILQTMTRIPDNTTTSIVINFLDTYITGVSQATDFAKEIEPPPCVDIYYSKSLNCLVLTGVNTTLPPPFGTFNLSGGHLLSNVSFPEQFYAPDNIIQVGDTDGERTICWREYGQIQMSCKEDSFWQVIPVTGATPQNWGVLNMWQGSGLAGARAIDISDDFFAYAHKTGAYRHPDSVTGLPDLISLEIKPTWDRINWNFKHTIWVKIDKEEKEVLFGVPLDDAANPTHILRCSYRWGWADPVVFSVRARTYIPNPNGRKWSIDPIQSYGAAEYRNRTLETSISNRVNTRQFVLLASDNTVKMNNPGVYHDDDAGGAPHGIDCQVSPVYAPNPSKDPLQFGGCTFSAIGNGQINVSAVRPTAPTNDQPSQVSTESTLISYDPNRDGTLMCPLGPVETFFDLQYDWYADEFTVLFDNGASQQSGPVADSWFEIHTTIIYTRVLFKGRP